MPETKARRLATALDEFISSSPDVEAAAVVSFDGLPMASALPETMEEDRVGAMSAALLSLGEQAAMGLGRGQLNQVFVEGEHGYVFLMSARDQAVLAAVARRSAKIGFMLFEMRRAAEQIGDVLLSTDHPVAGDERPFDAADAVADPTPSYEAPTEDPWQPRAADEPSQREPVHHAPADEPVAHEPVHHEPVHHEPVHHEPVHHEPVHHEPAQHDAGPGDHAHEPAPWSSGVPEEHDLSAGPEADEPHEEFPYRPDADRSAAPWH